MKYEDVVAAMKETELIAAAARHTTLETTPLQAFKKGAIWGELQAIKTLSEKLQIPITTLAKKLDIPDDIIQIIAP